MPDPSGTFDACRIIDRDKCLVEDLGPDGTPRKKVAIVGFSSTTKHLAPYADLTWSVWGMNQLYRMVPRLTRWFEIHPHPPAPRSWLYDQAPDTDYFGWMKTCPVPLYMQSEHPEIPTSLTYPLAAMIERFRLGDVREDLRERGYFHSSVDYMLALAIAEGFEEIGVYGIDMAHDSEYQRQKPSASFWLGIAHALGIKVTIPPVSALLNNMGYRYGYDPEPDFEVLNLLGSRMRALHDRRLQLTQEVNAIDGALQENAHWTEYHKVSQRGGTMVPATSTHG